MSSFSFLNESEESAVRAGFERRRFCKGLLGVGLASASPASARPPAAGGRLPSIQIAGLTLSRLIAGGNPVSGFSHSTPKLDQHMLQYFTVERTAEFLLHCEAEGINTWQSSYRAKVRDALLAARERGSKMQYICLASERQNKVMDEILALKPVAIVHHGEVTDDLFQAGKPEKIREFVKKVHDLGLPAGISTHSPENLARIEDLGWEQDFYMACFYNIRRSPQEIRGRLGGNVLDELYLQSDPGRMAECVRKLSKPCLVFKILAAGRLCGSRESIEAAFAFAFASIKPADGVIVGMYPVFSDEVREDAELTRKYGHKVLQKEDPS